MTRGVVVLLAFFVFAASASAGGPYMAVGSAEDVAKQQDAVFAKTQMDRARLAGLDTIRVTETWTRGQTSVGGIDRITLANVVGAAQFTGIRVILSLYPFGSSVTPLTDADRADFAAFCVDAVKRFPYVKDFIVGNEPNLNRFWLPQFGPDGEDVAAPAYVALLETAYDAIKAVRPHSTIYGGALAPRGVDKPNTGRDTHSPTAFIADMGAAYRASGRVVPLMDAFAFHPYGETSSTPPTFAHPLGTSIGIADYPKLVGLLGQAFDGTAQRGSTLPIIYDEYGVETTVPASKARLYTGTEPATTRPVDEATQAQFYAQAMAMSFCQQDVIGLLLFHVQDEPGLPAWQSGQYYVDGTPKSSLGPTRDAAGGVHRGVAAHCDGMALTPKLSVTAVKVDRKGLTATLTCTLDCSYVATLDGRRAVRGIAVGRLAKRIVWRGKVSRGKHVVSAEGTATVNPGPPASGSRSLLAR